MNIYLRIYDYGQRYEMDIVGQGEVHERIPISVTEKYLRQINTRLKEPTALLMYHAAIGGDLAREEWETDLVGMARAGQSVFTDIFGESGAQETMKNHLAAADRIIIEVNSEHFFVPWELLYSEDLTKKPSLENFWGMKYVIYHLINQRKRPADRRATTTINVDSKPRFGLFTFKDARLPNIGAREIPFFNDLDKDGKIALRKLPRLDPTVNKKETELHRFKQFLKQSRHVVHFACHALSNEKDPLKSFIQLSDGIQISLADLSQAPTALMKGFPLVVLNACSTGRLSPMNVRYFAGNFIQYGALGVVATEANVPDNLAADFTQKLYPHLLNGEYLGDSVLRTRQELWEQGNPVGLLYALYGSPIIRLAIGKSAGNEKRPRRNSSPVTVLKK